jgi:predicted nucleotidyltransferase
MIDSTGRISESNGRRLSGYTLGMQARLPADLEKTLTAYRRLLETEFGRRLRSVRLFGSRARGDADVDSDADVSVVVDGLTEAERARVVDLAFDAWRHAGCRGPLISPLPWSEAELEARRRAERRIALDIDREGVLL